MIKKQTQHVNGKHSYYSFLAGGNNVVQNQKELNRINVFPVTDKDTGTNLASTIRAVIDNLKPNKSYKTTIDNIAEAALIGARGNSGIIEDGNSLLFGKIFNQRPSLKRFINTLKN